MTTDIASLRIEPRSSWRPVSSENPLVCVVKIRNQETVVETALPPRAMHELLHVIRGIVSDAAMENVNAFCDAVVPKTTEDAAWGADLRGVSSGEFCGGAVPQEAYAAATETDEIPE